MSRRRVIPIGSVWAFKPQRGDIGRRLKVTGVSPDQRNVDVESTYFGSSERTRVVMLRSTLLGDYQQVES